MRPIDHKQVNKRTDENSILYQASIFNGTGRVFAPRYRQAHLDMLFNKKKAESGKKALEVAYSDVVAAFDYYMQHWNNGRRFIIAGHSQGALHAMTLIKQKVEGTPLQNQLIAAYIIGWPVQKDYFKALKPCETADQTGCFCTWRTWNREYVLENQNDPRFKPGVVCTNPLLWRARKAYMRPKRRIRADWLSILKSFNLDLPMQKCSKEYCSRISLNSKAASSSAGKITTSVI